MALQMWDSNTEAVRQLQEMLYLAGFDPGPGDGQFGPQTLSALNDFQVSLGLPRTDYLDDNTASRLTAYTAPPAAPTAAPAPVAQLPEPVFSTAPTMEPPAAVNPGLTADQRSANTIIQSTLGQYGLSSLADWAWQQYLQGSPIESIMFDLRQRPEYQQRFPAMQALAQGGHAISEAQYISYESTVTQLMRQYGLPQGFYDQPDDFTALLTGFVSPAEINARLSSYSDIINAQDPNALAQMQQLYGVSTGDLMAYAIDPNRALPLLQRQVQASLTSASAVSAGYGPLTQAEAERYAGASAQGFGQLASMGEVFGSLPGENVGDISRSVQLGAAFDSNAQDQAVIANRQRRRTAEFEAGGTYTTSQRGISGLGASTR